MFSGGIEIEQWHETDKFKKTVTNHRHLLHIYHCSFKLSKKTNISHPLIRTSKCEKKNISSFIFGYFRTPAHKSKSKGVILDELRVSFNDRSWNV